MIINDDKVMMLNCSFCKKNQKNVESILASEYDVCICNECILLCSDIIKNRSFNTIFTFFLPYDIYNFLDKHIVGQEKAKKVLSVSIYNHYNKIFRRKVSRYKKVSVTKSNILMIGSTGCGKTLLVQTLAKNLGIPITMADATSMTEAGYVGEDVENILSRLLKASNNNVHRAEYGIVYIDEIDKISKRADSGHNTRDVSGEGVQQSLLKLMEGVILFIPPIGLKKHPNQQCIKINTKNILFIFSGAFEGINKIVKDRSNIYNLGFNDYIQHSERLFINHLDLIKYGMIPEFIGRVSQIVSLNSLSFSMIIKILNSVSNSLIAQYQKIFTHYNIIFLINGKAQQQIAKISLKKKMGARGIKSVIESLILNIMFVAPSQNFIKKIIIDSIL